MTIKVRGSARSIAQPVAIMLATQIFRGEIHSVFNRACNLVDHHQEIITLALPELENGPFSILMEETPTWWPQLQPGQPVLGAQKHLQVGPWEVDLAQGEIWKPQLSAPDACPFKLSPAIAGIMAPYRRWPVDDSPTWDGRMAAAFHKATKALVQAIQIDAEVGGAARPLAGLGPGLTPAGDDYLLGVMAALWLLGKNELAQEIAGVAFPRTTLLSGAFLRAAGRGSFAEGWRRLAEALLQGQEQAVAEACKKLSRWGATSGRAALAGFTSTLLNVA